MQYDTSSSFKSSLAFNGTVSWSNATAQLSNTAESHARAELSVSFPEIDWTSLQQVYGWAALQWQGWIRGQIIIRGESTRTLTFNAKQALEFWIDDEHYFGGDVYGFGRAPVTLHLVPGTHRVDVRLFRDVRAAGGSGEPSMDLTLDLDESSEVLQPLQSDDGLYATVIVADVYGDDTGRLNSPVASATVRNDAQKDVYVIRAEGEHNRCEAELVSQEPIRLVPGQTRPLPFKLDCVPPIGGRKPMSLNFIYRIDGIEEEKRVNFMAWPRQRGRYEPQKITYMHPGGIVSYAILRPPSANADCSRSGNESLPILLQLHGSGVEADSDEVRHSLDPLPDLCAWVLYPTGVTTWCGDDWHQWGLSDIEAAVAAIPAWIERNEWKGPGVDVNRWLVSGHSNGGQGAWYIATHRPDKVIAAAPVSGYSSIQNYVPYNLWHPSEPARMSVVHSVLNSYRHELLLENVKDIPILMQHGSADDNVPPFHARLMGVQLQQAGGNGTLVEMEGKPHYWDGVMTTGPLAEFYKEHLNKPAREKIPRHLKEFTIVSANFGDMGPRYGVDILQLLSPGQLGKIHVSFNPLALGGCIFRTSNIRQFLVPLLFSECSIVGVDGQSVAMSWSGQSNVSLTLQSGQWESQPGPVMSSDDYFPPMPPRMAANQLGPLDAILRTRGVPSIVVHSAAAQKIALQVSRNLYQYFAADSAITDDYDKAINHWGNNIISIAIGPDLPAGIEAYKHAINIFSEHIEIADLDHRQRSYGAANGLAAIFLRPTLGRRLELVVWGVDEKSLDVAARLVPMMAGSGQPDFVIADGSMLWKGLEGTLALGFLDSYWKMTRNSYLV